MPSVPDHRVEALRARLEELGADALLVTDSADLRWACGFTGSNGLLLWVPSGPHFVTDGRYGTQARTEVFGASVHAPGYDLIGHLQEANLLHGLNRIAFASDSVTASTFDRLRTVFPRTGWEGVTNLLGAQRAVKLDAEIGSIRRAQRIAEATLLSVVNDLQVGLSERDVAAEIAYRAACGGSESMAFDCIVAFGDHSALPHARPGDRALQRGDLVLIDFGCVVDGYASDMTRMVAFGEPDRHVEEIVTIVTRALESAEEVLAPGIPARTVDAAARDVIVSAGHGDAFPHSLGHGVGLSVHEHPTLSWRTDQNVPADAVVTLEPGIYLPGAFGVRIEDLYHVGEEGCDTLTTIERDLIRV